MARQPKTPRMLTHGQVWAALDRLAERAGLSPSGLARRAGLDPTTFNKSKRVTADGRYLIAKLNVDENRRVAAQYAIQGIPTLLIFKHGQLVDRLVGAHPKQTIAARLEKAVTSDE